MTRVLTAIGPRLGLANRFGVNVKNELGICDTKTRHKTKQYQFTPKYSTLESAYGSSEAR